MISDDDRDIDIESDDDNDSDNGTNSQRHTSTQNYTQEEKRAHHNALERKRRDHIKESFSSLREAVPTLKGEKASRAQILKKTTECIQMMRRKIQTNQKAVDDIKKQNAMLEAQIQMLQTTKDGCSLNSNIESHQQQLAQNDQCAQQDSSDNDEQEFSRRSKKMKTSYQA